LAAAAPFATEKGRDIYGKIGKGLLKGLSVAGTPLGVAAYEVAGPGGLRESIQEGRTAEDIATDPFTYASLPFANIASQTVSNPTLQRILSLGLPARAVGALTPIGLTAIGATTAYQGIKSLKEEIERRSLLTPEQRQQEDIDREIESGRLAETGQFAMGGRVGFKDGPKDPSKRKFIKGAGILGALGVATKYAPELFTTIKKAAKGAGKILPKVSGMPEWFPSLVAKIEKQGKYMSEGTGLEDNLKIKQLTIPSKTGKGGDEIYTMIQHSNGDIVIEANVKGGAFEGPFELHYKAPKSDIDVTTGTPIKEPGEFNVMENRPRSTAASHHDADYEIDYDLVSYDQAISDVERAERVATGKRIDPRRVQEREAARKYVEENPYDDIVNRYGDYNYKDVDYE
jgi:hypothetical protein